MKVALRGDFLRPVRHSTNYPFPLLFILFFVIYRSTLCTKLKNTILSSGPGSLARCSLPLKFCLYLRLLFLVIITLLSFLTAYLYEHLGLCCKETFYFSPPLSCPNSLSNSSVFVILSFSLSNFCLCSDPSILPREFAPL